MDHVGILSVYTIENNAIICFQMGNRKLPKIRRRLTMEIRRIKGFRTIVEAGGLTKAASLMHVTPGALSKSMRQLEREVGQRLFNRKVGPCA